MVDIHPIRNDADHRAAVAEVERLWRAPSGTSDGDTLDILITLIDAYEETRWPIEAADPIEALTYAIEEMGHSQSELADLLGSRSRASEILSRKRALTVEMIHKISTAWHIPPAVLVRPYETDNAV
jgi:HTH-type transcriptional regulator/antitoxin HigA